MKSKSITWLIIVLVAIASVAYVAANGIEIGGIRYFWNLLDKQHGIKRGFDLSGGSIIAYEAQADTVTSEQMDIAAAILKQRLYSLGYTEGTVGKEGEKRIVVEIPEIQDPEEAVQMLGQTAKLTFVDADGTELFDGSLVDTAKHDVIQKQGVGGAQNVVTLKLKPEAQKIFADATGKAAAAGEGKNYIAIKMDTEVISQPSVSQKIDSDTCYIESSTFTPESASNLANLIQSGSLPFELKDVELRSVGPQLGEAALESSLMAALIGILIILLFMIVMYRLPGLVADVALVAYISVVCIILAVLRVNLNLPGIAGIILSIGMAVDANVIIFERIKEEMRTGKTLRSAVDSGFHRAMTAIIDGNVTTIISAVVLYIFGPGPIKGFATTLIIGVVVSMLTAITLTRFIMKQVVGLNIRNQWLYGIKEAKR